MFFFSQSRAFSTIRSPSRLKAKLGPSRPLSYAHMTDERPNLCSSAGIPPSRETIADFRKVNHGMQHRQEFRAARFLTTALILG